MPASLSLRQPPETLAERSDSDLLTQLGWDASTPAALVKAARSGDPVAFGRAWRQRHRQRRSGPAARELLAIWSPQPGIDAAVGRALDTLAKSAQTRKPRRPSMKPQPSWTVRVQPLLKALTRSDRPATVTPGELLLELELLWTLGDRLPQRVWWPLWRRTLEDVWRLQSASVSPASPDERLLTDGELPVLTALVFGDIAGSPQLARKGQRTFARELAAHTDSDGTPHGELLPRLPYWLAPLVRTTRWCRQAEVPVWDEDERQLISDIVEKAVALCRADGRLALTNGETVDVLPILQQAAELFQWSATNPSRSCLRSLAEHRNGKARSSSASAISIMPSNQSDWARVALLRTDWTAAAASIAVSHHQPLPKLDVTIASEPLLHGMWDLEMRIGDAAIELADEWSCVCWESQPDADYAELQMEGPGKLRVERLILLSREDQFLMLADSISGAQGGRVALRSRLPLASGVKAEFEHGTRAARLESSRLKVRMLPLALPAETVHSTPHRCELANGELRLEYLAEGQGLFAPLIFDFHPQRRRRPVTWKRQTVTENGQVVGGETAAAFRWKLGREQWLVYRSLKAPKVPRATLGYHTGNDFAIGRFDGNGDVDPILMVAE